MSWANASNDNPFEAPAAAPAAAAPIPAAPTSNAPSWLSGSQGAPAGVPAAAAPPQAPQPQTAGQAMGGVATQKAGHVGPVPAVVKHLRLINLLCSLGVTILAAITLLTSLTSPNGDVTVMVMCMYVFFFGMMVCCFELQLKAVAQYISGNFGFFFDAKLRALFLIFVAMLCWSLGLPGIIMGSTLCFLASINLFALCKYPDYISAPAISEEQRNKALKQAGGMAAGAYLSSQVPAQPQTTQV
ncbi:hypothetical protein TrCOL_g13539 [Triparma columacea]|uniref:Uncharacterized protein n=1 Tax=Triparma columacea TaxID=722753 RepID=A0A9W7GF71_9STRA|nr:hypothetical protein TrCOL_g13539 [Triparma columacea]